MAEIDFGVSLEYRGIQSQSGQPTKSLQMKERKLENI